MSNHPQSSDEAQFIVIPRKTAISSASNPLVELRRIAASRDVTVVRVVGSDDQPVRLIIRGPRAGIAELGEQFARELLFEEDLPISPI